jgi:hypothetical protein
MHFYYCEIFDVSELEHPYTEDNILVCPPCWDRLKGYAILSSRKVAPDTNCKVCRRRAGEIFNGKAPAVKQKEDSH